MPQDLGSDSDTMQIAGDKAALRSDALYIHPTTFTPINRPGAQRLAPQCSTSPPQNSQTRAANDAQQRHHPFVVRYFGLGKDEEPPHLQKLAPELPAIPPTPPTNRKRGRKAREGKSPFRTTRSAQPRSSKQRRISDANVGFRVSKAASSGIRKAVTVSTVSLIATKDGTDPPIENIEHAEDARRSLSGLCGTTKRPTELSSFSNPTTLTQAFAALTNTSPKSSYTLVASNASRAPPCSGDQSQETIADEFFDDVFDSMDLDSTFPETSPDTRLPDAPDDVDSSAAIHANSDVLLSTPDLTDDLSFLLEPNEKLDELEVKPTGYGSAFHGSLESGDVQGPSSQFISPVTRRTEALTREEARKKSHATDRKPIVRAAFPDAVGDRSPIVGLSPKLMLRSCFRVGEAISQAGKATKQGQNLLFELYARVISSERDAAKQYFVFSDLFHHRPPYLKGEYDAAIWKNVELFNYDSGRFLTNTKMCRCIGKIKRNEKDRTWVMVILNIWEATWEDIDWVEGIVKS